MQSMCFRCVEPGELRLVKLNTFGFQIVSPKPHSLVSDVSQDAAHTVAYVILGDVSHINMYVGTTLYDAPLYKHKL